MHGDARDETRNSDLKVRNLDIATLYLCQDRVSQNEDAEAPLKNEDSDRLRHHIEHVLLQLELLSQHQLRMTLDIFVSFRFVISSIALFLIISLLQA